MLAADARHWWYRGRRRIMRAQLERLELRPDARLLDAGCGSGEMLDELGRFGRAMGIDIDRGSVELAHERGRDVRLASLFELPYPDGWFDLVACLDVLEHLDNDRAALRELLRVTAPGAVLLVSVPAYQSLWSAHDEANLHRRRYRASGLKEVIGAAGWIPQRHTYFNSLLLPPAAAVRLAERRRRRPRPEGVSDLHLTPPLLDPVLELPMRLEAALIRRGGAMPAGLSLLAMARRPARTVMLHRRAGAPVARGRASASVSA